MLDVITGIVNAGKNGNIESTVMRKGLYNKVGEMVSLGAIHLLEFATANVDLGVDLHLFNVVSIYIIAMEAISVLENICLMNEGLAKVFAPILSQLNHLIKKEDKIDV